MVERARDDQVDEKEHATSIDTRQVFLGEFECNRLPELLIISARFKLLQNSNPPNPCDQGTSDEKAEPIYCYFLSDLKITCGVMNIESRWDSIVIQLSCLLMESNSGMETLSMNLITHGS